MARDAVGENVVLVGVNGAAGLDVCALPSL